MMKTLRITVIWVRADRPRVTERVRIDASASTPALVQQSREHTYVVDYSVPSCRRLRKEAGLRYQNPRHTAAKATVDERAECRDNRKKAAGNGHYSSVSRANEEIRTIEPCADAIPARHVDDRRILWTTCLDVVTEPSARFEEHVTPKCANTCRSHIIV
ncbi:winged helix-turn-helix domain-containing protein [Natribaculum luteum]|uniref:Winged helix-turn-helix domain-containing protein n=1 Tax=Natribaculum luteum TaxID=1586232 RepID=A0ABD5NW27_9EURY